VFSSATASRLLRHRNPRHVLTMGVTGLLVTAPALLALALSPVNVAWLPLPIFFAVSSLGFIPGPVTAMALNAVPGAVGAGSAVLGAAQFGLAALVSPLVSLGGDRSTVPAAITIATLAVLAALCAAASPGRGTSDPRTPPRSGPRRDPINPPKPVG
jgi:DHA1 family bicyclomycin/chloramphenicol resistance-like MFS transporter